MKFAWILILSPLILWVPGLVLGQTATPTATVTPNCCMGMELANGFSSPKCMAVDDKKGYLYVTDYTGNSIKVFTQSATPVATISAWNGGQLNHPTDVGLDNQGNIYVTDEYNSVVEEFDPQYHFVASIGVSAILGDILGIFVDNQGPSTKLYVSSQSGPNGLVYRFDWNGSAYNSSVSFGQGILSFPAGIAKKGNVVYVVDSSNARVIGFNESANIYSAAMTYSNSGLSFSPRTICTDLAGNFYSGAGDLFVFQPDFTLDHVCPGNAGFFWGVAINNGGAVFASGGSNNSVTVFQSCVVEPTATPTVTPIPYYKGSNPPTAGNCFIYPSPAKGNQATLSYNMSASGQVDLKIWNLRAELVSHVTDQKPAGVQVTPFSIVGLPNGVYFYSLTRRYDSGQVEEIKPKKFVIIH